GPALEGPAGRTGATPPDRSPSRCRWGAPIRPRSERPGPHPLRLRPIPRAGQRPESPPLHGDPRAEAPPPTDLGALRRPGTLEGAELGDAALAPEESHLRRGVRLRSADRRPGAADSGPSCDGTDSPAAGPLAGLGQGRLPGVHYVGGARTDPSDDRG